MKPMVKIIVGTIIGTVCIAGSGIGGKLVGEGIADKVLKR